jgi:hypothetical protein
MINPNFSQEQSYQPLDPGMYNFKIVACEQGVSNKSQNKYVKWELEEIKSKYKLNYVTMIEGTAVGMFRHFVKSAGIENYDDTAIDEAEILGNLISCKVDNEPYISQKDGSTKIKSVVKQVSKMI